MLRLVKDKFKFRLGRVKAEHQILTLKSKQEEQSIINQKLGEEGKNKQGQKRKPKKRKGKNVAKRATVD